MERASSNPWRQVARWVSIVAHPFVLMPLLVVAASARAGRDAVEMVRMVGVVALFCILPMVILTIRQRRRGLWENVDASKPKERPILYLVGLLGMAGLLGYLLFVARDAFMVRGLAVALVMLAFCGLITRWIKVSLHLAAAAFTAVTLLLIGSPAGWVIAAIVPLLGWSRVVLGRHTVPEVLVGLVVGVAAGMFVR